MSEKYASVESKASVCPIYEEPALPDMPAATPAILTGSYVYGTPHEDSDIDLVVLVNDLTHYCLLELVGQEKDFRYSGGLSIRFGKLNLLLCRTWEQYEVWRKGTKELANRRPVTRDEAVELFSRLRKEAGVDG